MSPRIISLLASLLFVALAWGPSAAHLLELPVKTRLSKSEYLTVQQIYRGWALLGIVVAGALLSCATFALLSRGSDELHLALIALLSVAGTQAMFWLWTAPANRATANWTSLPEDWQRLRTQWEYSHACSAALNLLALLALLGAAGRMIGSA